MMSSRFGGLTGAASVLMANSENTALAAIIAVRGVITSGDGNLLGHLASLIEKPTP